MSFKENGFVFWNIPNHSLIFANRVFRNNYKTFVIFLSIVIITARLQRAVAVCHFNVSLYM